MVYMQTAHKPQISEQHITFTIQSDLEGPCRHTLVLNHVAQEENHHAEIDLARNNEQRKSQY